MASGSDLYSSDNNSWLHLSIGTYGSSTGGSETFLSGVICFTNVLTDSELWAWMTKLKYPNNF